MSEEVSWITVKQLAAMTGLSKPTIYRNCHQDAENPWPCQRIGASANARIRFTPQQVAAIVAMTTSRPARAAKDADEALLLKAAGKILKSKVKASQLRTGQGVAA